MIGVTTKPSATKYSHHGRRTSSKAILTGVNKTRRTNTLEISAAQFNLLLLNIPILKREWFERILKRHPRVGDSIVFRNAEFYVRKIRRYQVWEFNLKRHNVDDD